MGHIMDEFTFNRPAINPQINDYGFIMEPPLDIAPLVINSYLPQLMDSTMVNNPFMWPVVSGSAGSNTQNSSIAGNTTQNSSIAGNTTQNSSNNYYCNYTIPADCNSHYLSTPAHQSLPPDTTMYQYDSLVGAGSLSAPDNNSTLPFDYTGQGMMGCASSMMMPVPLQQKPPSPPSPALQQQQLLLEYPMTMRGLEGGSMNPSLMYGRYDQQRAAAFHGLDGNSDKMMFSSIGGNQKLPQV
ncbi:hypothetical protein SAY87_000128 [Trapa incisa]|uniref:Uncharacterized protein n=1 Tax=Trapa incisa TaxID=236973 RepID=A0AAN7GMS3_9MYRT|nr:hypothetical protein SAY87_000128 [Trapa incisa]